MELGVWGVDKENGEEDEEDRRVGAKTKKSKKEGLKKPGFRFSCAQACLQSSMDSRCVLSNVHS